MFRPCRNSGSAVAALAFRVHSRVEQNAVVVNFDQPRARADVGVGIQICDIHEKISGAETKQFAREAAIKIGVPSLKTNPLQNGFPFGPEFIYVRLCGPVAQRLEQATHNRLVPGSNPGGPTNFQTIHFDCELAALR